MILHIHKTSNIPYEQFSQEMPLWKHLVLINSFGINDKTLRNYKCIPLIKLFEIIATNKPLKKMSQNFPFPFLPFFFLNN